MKNSSKVVFLAQATEKKEAVSDTTPAKENTEVVATEVKKEGGEKAETGKEEKKEEGEEKPESNFAGIGVGELLVFIGFLGAFLFAFFRNLAKRPISPENDPYLKENERLVVTYS